MTMMSPYITKFSRRQNATKVVIPSEAEEKSREVHDKLQVVLLLGDLDIGWATADTAQALLVVLTRMNQPHSTRTCNNQAITVNHSKML